MEKEDTTPIDDQAEAAKVCGLTKETILAIVGVAAAVVLVVVLVVVFVVVPGM